MGYHNDPRHVRPQPEAHVEILKPNTHIGIRLNHLKQRTPIKFYLDFYILFFIK